MRQAVKGLYVILDQGSLGRRDSIATAKSLLNAGVRALQYRAKGVGDAALYDTCRKLADFCRRRGIPFIVNDRCDVAASVNAAGVHLGTEDLPFATAKKILGPGKIIGLSSHSLTRALRKARLRPGYIAVGPVFRSSSKRTKRRLLGIATIRKIASRVCCPVVAVGGMNAPRARQARQAGASAVAVIGAVLGKRNPVLAAKAIISALRV